MARPRRPVRNIATRSWCADVRRFLRLIKTDEVFGTHSGRHTCMYQKPHPALIFIWQASANGSNTTTRLDRTRRSDIDQLLHRRMDPFLTPLDQAAQMQ